MVELRVGRGAQVIVPEITAEGLHDHPRGRGGRLEKLGDFVGWPAIDAETETRQASRRIPVKLDRYAIKAMRVVINSVVLT